MQGGRRAGKRTVPGAEREKKAEKRGKSENFKTKMGKNGEKGKDVAIAATAANGPGIEVRGTKKRRRKNRRPRT